MSADVVIIGGGISGLTAGYRLSRRGLQVEVLEADEELGGLIRCVERPGYKLERLYHHFFEHDKSAIDLLHELGLSDDLVWNSTRTGFYHEGQWYDVSKPSSLLVFKPLSFSERIRLGWALLQSKRSTGGDGLDGVSVADWLGLEEGSGMQRVFDRLVRGKFGVGTDEISAAFLSGRFEARARKRPILKRKERFGYLKGSLRRLADRLVERIEEQGGRILTGAKVAKIAKDSAGFSVKTDDGREVTSGAVLSSIPPGEFCGIADFLDREERKTFSAIGYTGVVCMVCGLDRSLSPFYWGTIGDADLGFMLLVEQNHLFRPPGCVDEHLFYMSRYAMPDFIDSMNLVEVEQEMLSGIERAAGGRPPKLLWKETSVFRAATPVYRVGFGELLRRMPKLDGVWMTGASFIYPGSRNVNSMIRKATETSESVLQWFGNRGA